jgi:hypothetical protein
MGNKSSSSCSSGINNETNNLTDYDMTVYKMRKEKIFYGTIAICVTYGIIALLLLIASYLSDKIRYILLTRFLPFTVVYIIGTIIIVLYLLHQVLNFKAIKIEKKNKYDENSCPDYWKLKTYNLNDVKPIFDPNINANYFKTRCVLDNDNKIFNKSELATTYDFKFDNTGTTSNMHANLYHADNRIENNILKDITNETNNSNIYYSLIKNSFIMNNYKVESEDNNSITFKINPDFITTANKSDIKGYTYNATPGVAAGSAININTTTDNTIRYYKLSAVETSKRNKYYTVTADGVESVNPITNVPFVCDSVYPSYLASQDMLLSKTNSKLDQNVFRCAYSKICNMPWSEINCDAYYK